MKPSLIVLAVLLSFLALPVSAQTTKPVTIGVYGDTEPEAIPAWRLMFAVFSHAETKDQENPGDGVKFVKDVIKTPDEAAAKALFSYMRAAYYAVHASSHARLREFCSINITTADALIDGLEQRRQKHEAEIERLMMSAADVVDPEAFAALVAHAETRRSLSGFVYTDYRATYTSADPRMDVARLCQHVNP